MGIYTGPVPGSDSQAIVAWILRHEGRYPDYFTPPMPDFFIRKDIDE